MTYAASWWIGDRYTYRRFISNALEYDPDNLNGVRHDAERACLISPSGITIADTGDRVWPKDGILNGRGV